MSKEISPELRHLFETEGKAQIATLIGMAMNADDKIGFLSSCAAAFCLVARAMDLSEESCLETIRNVYRATAREMSDS